MDLCAELTSMPCCCEETISSNKNGAMFLMSIVRWLIWRTSLLRLQDNPATMALQTPRQHQADEHMLFAQRTVQIKKNLQKILLTLTVIIKSLHQPRRLINFKNR